MSNAEALNTINVLMKQYKGLAQAKEVLEAVQNAEQLVKETSADIPRLTAERQSLVNSIEALKKQETDELASAHAKIKEANDEIDARVSELEIVVKSRLDEADAQVVSMLDKANAELLVQKQSLEADVKALINRKSGLAKAVADAATEADNLIAKRDEIKAQLANFMGDA